MRAFRFQRTHMLPCACPLQEAHASDRDCVSTTAGRGADLQRVVDDRDLQAGGRALEGQRARQQRRQVARRVARRVAHLNQQLESEHQYT